MGRERVHIGASEPLASPDDGVEVPGQVVGDLDVAGLQVLDFGELVRDEEV